MREKIRKLQYEWSLRRGRGGSPPQSLIIISEQTLPGKVFVDDVVERRDLFSTSCPTIINGYREISAFKQKSGQCCSVVMLSSRVYPGLHPAEPPSSDAAIPGFRSLENFPFKLTRIAGLLCTGCCLCNLRVCPNFSTSVDQGRHSWNRFQLCPYFFVFFVQFQVPLSV